MMLPISQQEMQKEELPREEGTLPSLRPAREPLTYSLAVTGWGFQGTLHLETNWQTHPLSLLLKSEASEESL